MANEFIPKCWSLLPEGMAEFVAAQEARLGRPLTDLEFELVMVAFK